MKANTLRQVTKEVKKNNNCSKEVGLMEPKTYSKPMPEIPATQELRQEDCDLGLHGQIKKERKIIFINSNIPSNSSSKLSGTQTWKRE